MNIHRFILLASLALAVDARAQAVAAPATTGTLVIVPATGEVRQANDEATVSFGVEEQDKDRAAATARVNQKMAQGTAILRREDPQARLKTTGYYTYPVYPEVPDSPRPLSAQAQAARRVPIGWRVGQTLEATTHGLDALPKTASAVQKVLNLNGVDYHLSTEAQRRMDDERIATAYRNLKERIGSIARAMGRNPADAVIDTVDFEASGNYAGAAEAAPVQHMAAMRMKSDAPAPEVSFEPGETALEMRVVGKVRFR